MCPMRVLLSRLLLRMTVREVTRNPDISYFHRTASLANSFAVRRGFCVFHRCGNPCGKVEAQQLMSASHRWIIGIGNGFLASGSRDC